MGTDASELAEALPYPCAIKLHRLMCLEFMKLVERISMVFPEIEAAHPRCHSGIKVLCSLYLALDKAKSLLQQCSESSKLYLALSGDAILSRCERLRASLEQSLSQIQSMVPVALAVEISGIINDLRSATFSLESSEEEAGKFLRSLLQDASASDPAETATLRKPVPPKEFVCPISTKLMYDPVLIASGQTFERMWIQKWLDEGHDTCPKSKIKLAHQSLIPNTALKDLISKWCRDQGVVISDASIKSAPLEPWENSSTSLSSLGSSLNDIRLHLDVSSVSLGSLDTSCSSDSSQFKTMESSGLIPVKTTDGSNGHES